jgi:hypothetical protein
MNIGDDWQTGLFLNRLQNFQPLYDTGAAIGWLAPTRSAISRKALAMLKVCSRLSIAQGPAINTRGLSPPIFTDPADNILFIDHPDLYWP